MSEEDKKVLQASYDRVAREYTRHIAGELEHKPLDRELLDALAARMREAGAVLDLGCGPGHVAGYLHARGVEVHGIDLSPEMVSQARALHPAIPFSVGDLTKLESPDGVWAGAVAFYSLIHLPRSAVTAALCEVRRVLRPGGVLLVAFHVGTEVRHLDALWGEPVQLDFVFFEVAEMERNLEAAGFIIEARYEREPYPDVEAQTRRCYLVATSGPAECRPAPHGRRLIGR